MNYFSNIKIKLDLFINYSNYFLKLILHLKFYNKQFKNEITNKNYVSHLIYQKHMLILNACIPYWPVDVITNKSK
jgi:hypothetical protein